MAKGGKLKATEVKDFLNASYRKTPPDDLDGYTLDKSLSSATAKVYYNPQTNHAVVAHRGTKGKMDWTNNLAYAVGAYTHTNRYKQGKAVQDRAEAKYGKQNISTLGYSQGAILARKLGADTKEVINVNGAYLGERPAKNEYNIRSSTDVISGLYAPVAKTREFLYPKYSEKHDITIPSQSATDVLGEHSYDILDRIGDKEIGVGAGNNFSSNAIMKGGKRYSRLGYTGDDIDWIGGGTTQSAPQHTRTRAENLARAQEALRTIDGAMNRRAREERQVSRLERDPYIKEGVSLPQPKPKRGAGTSASKVSPITRAQLFVTGLNAMSEAELEEEFENATEDQINEFSRLLDEYSHVSANQRDEIAEQLLNLHASFAGVGEVLGNEAEEKASSSGDEEKGDEEKGDEEVTGGALNRNEYRRLKKLASSLNRRMTKLQVSNDTQWNGVDIGEHLENIENLLDQLDTLGEDDDDEDEEDLQEQEEELTTDLLNAINEANAALNGVEGNITDFESADEDSESEEEVGAGRRGKNPFKKLQKGITKVGTAFGKAGDAMNPMAYAIKNKGTRDAMISSGDATNNYILPAVVSAGKPIYDATAMTASTMLTGNPVLGKVAADALWNGMVGDKGYDPRDRQKSAELGTLSDTLGKAVAKPYSASLSAGGSGISAPLPELPPLPRRTVLNANRRQYIQQDLDRVENRIYRLERGMARRVRRGDQIEPGLFDIYVRNTNRRTQLRRMMGRITPETRPTTPDPTPADPIDDLEPEGNLEISPELEAELQAEEEATRPAEQTGRGRKKAGKREPPTLSQDEIREIFREEKKAGMRDLKDYRIPSSINKLKAIKEEKGLQEWEKYKNDRHIQSLLWNKKDTDDDYLNGLMTQQERVMKDIERLDKQNYEETEKLKKSEDFVKSLDRSKHLKGFETADNRIIYGEGRADLTGGSAAAEGLTQLALYYGIPVATLVGLGSLLQRMGRGEHGAVAPEPLPAPIPQQGEFKEEMPDIEEGGKIRRKRQSKKGKK